MNAAGRAGTPADSAARCRCRPARIPLAVATNRLFFKIHPPAMKTSTGNRIGVQGEMIGGDSNALVQQLSWDLAQQDGRAEARDSDRELALRELTGPGRDPAPEVPPGAERLVTWNANPEEAGHLIPEIPAEDETDVSAEMAEEGRGEAEQDLRRAVNAEPHLRHEPPHPG
jgi:hypothetical protein